MSGEEFSRALPALAWCALVLLGVIVLVAWGPHATTAVGPKALRALPANTLIMPGDLIVDGFTGRYVVAQNGVAQGKILLPADVSAAPAAGDKAHVQLLLSVPVRRESVVAGINAGANVKLCGKAPTGFGAVAVQFVQCDASGLGQNCVATVAVPTKSAGDLVAKGLTGAAIRDLHLARTCGQGG